MERAISQRGGEVYGQVNVLLHILNSLFALFRIVALYSPLRQIDWGFVIGQRLETERNPGLLVSSEMIISPYDENG